MTPLPEILLDCLLSQLIELFEYLNLIRLTVESNNCLLTLNRIRFDFLINIFVEMIDLLFGRY